MGDLGSFSPTWNHMRDAYPKWIRQSKVEEAWKMGPIASEPPLEVAEFVEKDSPLRWIFNYALALSRQLLQRQVGTITRQCAVSGRTGAVPATARLRLVLKELKHPA